MELQKFNSEKNMSSREISDLTGKRHDHVLRDCDKLNESYIKLSLPRLGECAYDSDNGQSYRAYILTKIQCFDLMTGYSAELRIKVNRRWEELEKQQYIIPQTYSEALLLAAEQAKQIELQEEQIKELAPKADFYDAVTGSSDTIDIGSVAKVLNCGIGRNKLFQTLRDKNILMKNNQPYQQYIDRGYFRTIESEYIKPDGSTSISIKTVVFQKGVDFIRKVIN